MAVQTLSVQDLYSRAGTTPSTSTRATAGATPRTPAPTGEAGMANGDLARAFATIGMSNPLYGFAVLALMLVGLSLLAQRVGTVEEFRDVRLSVYNVIVISLAAIIGINFWKVIFTRFPVPHITPVVLAT